MIASSAAAFADAIAAHSLDGAVVDGPTLAAARAAVDATAMLVVGEPHGARETPGALYALARATGARALALEWSHEEMEDVVQQFVGSGTLDLDALCSLPPTAELFCGDGRITAGHFALLLRLRVEGRLGQVILFDRLDPEPPLPDWQVRDRQMADRLLTRWDGQTRLLALTGAFHARLDADNGQTMAMCLARRLPGLQVAMIDYATGSCWSRGALHDVAEPSPPAAITVSLPVATPAVVLGRKC